MAAPVVETKQGKLKGTIRKNVDGGKYFSFRGVPFAEPPVGELRFKEPRSPKLWSGVRDALEDSLMSAQYDIISNTKEGGDDCLYLDIATNSLTEQKPVMVWIHGGGFKKSSNTYKKYSPDYLLKKEIVFVGINYRLGVLGFLNMEHEECAGNQGLKDQVAALKWIQENIEAFGGDSKNITIFGESAGGASVHALCMSSQAKGLFHRAIIQSGVLSNPWAHISSNKEYGYSLAKAFGRECSNDLEVIQFLRTIPALELVEMYENINATETLRLTLALVPTPDIKSSNPILPLSVKEIEKKGIDVPLLIGYNSHEGILRFIEDTSDFIKEIHNDFEKIIAEYLRISDSAKILNIAKEIRKFYFNDDEITEKKINELVQFFGDMLFVNNILGVVDIQMQKTSPTYLYKFSYRPNFPGIKERFNVKIEGTCHGDELGCLFFSEMRREKILEGTRDRLVMERLTSMWTNFARTGDPTPVINETITTKWKPVERSKKSYLEIDDNLTCNENPDQRMWNMWKPLLEHQLVVQRLGDLVFVGCLVYHQVINFGVNLAEAVNVGSSVWNVAASRFPTFICPGCSISPIVRNGETYEVVRSRGVPRYVCYFPDCVSVFAARDLYNANIMRYLTGTSVAVHICIICNKLYASQASLRKHM